MTRVGPYKMVAIFVQGHEEIVEQGFNPSAVHEAHRRIAHNPDTIQRIEFRDQEGALETIWDRSWT